MPGWLRRRADKAQQDISSGWKHDERSNPWKIDSSHPRSWQNGYGESGPGVSPLERLPLHRQALPTATPIFRARARPLPGTTTARGTLSLPRARV
jgi:hypothetical protein